MITFTDIMGIAAGSALLLLVWLGYRLGYRRTVGSVSEALPGREGWSLSLAALGAILILTGREMLLNAPLTLPIEKAKNAAFGGPALLFGVLLVLAALYLWLRGGADSLAVYAALRPVSLVVGILGLALLAMTGAAWDTAIFETAPPWEPVFGSWPAWLIGPAVSWILFGLPGLGATLFPLAVWRGSRIALATVGVIWTAAGIGLALCGIVGSATHIYMEVNTPPQ